MKVFVIGGAGFIGSHLVKYHLENGDEVRIIDDYSTGKKENIEGLDVIELHNYNSGLAWCDQVYLLAGSVGVRYVNGNPERAIKNNLAVETEVFELNNFYKKPLLFASTSEVYGNSNRLPFRECDPLEIGEPSQGRWGYACSKLMGEFMALHSEFPAVVVRFFNVTGVGQLPDYGMVLPSFVWRAANNKHLDVYGDGKAVRCFCDVEEVVPLLDTLLGDDHCHNQVFNIGNPENQITMMDLALMVCEEADAKPDIVKVPFDVVFEQNPTDIQLRIPSTDKVFEYTGWKPHNDTRTIVRKMVESGAYTDIDK
jgi:UDP-glucose 4-epimerase